METLELVLGILLLLMAVFLVISVLMQNSKSHRLSGTIAGGAETFFGKAKGRTIDAVLNKLTTVVAIIFIICVVAVYVIQPEPTVEQGQTIDLSQLDAIEEDHTGHDHDGDGVADDAVTTDEAATEDEVATEDNAVIEDETIVEDEVVTEDNAATEDEVVAEAEETPSVEEEVVAE